MAIKKETESDSEQRISTLEADIKKLQVAYDSYFAGGRKRPPSDVEFRVQQTIKRMMDGSARMKYAQRFRFNNIAQRYAKYSEVWRQRSMRVEQGHSAFSYSRTARELEKTRLEDAEAAHHSRIHPGESRSSSVGFSDPAKEPEKVKELYRTMMDSKKKAGESQNVSYEQFAKFVSQQTEQIRQKTGAANVQYQVAVKDGKVTLKAKVDK